MRLDQTRLRRHVFCLFEPGSAPARIPDQTGPITVSMVDLWALTHRALKLDPTVTVDGVTAPRSQRQTAALPSDPAVPDQPFTEGRWQGVYARFEGVGIEARIGAWFSPRFPRRAEQDRGAHLSRSPP